MSAGGHVDRYFVLAPGLRLYVTPNGWYALDWELRPGQAPNMKLALRTLRDLMDEGILPPSTNQRKYQEDSYRTVEDLIEDILEQGDEAR